MDLSHMRVEPGEDLGMRQPTIEMPDLFVAHVPGPCCGSLRWMWETKGPLPLEGGRKALYHGRFNGLLGVMPHLNATGAVGCSGRFS